MNSKIDYFKNIFYKETEKIYILDKEDGYTENFGKQWKDYRNVQIDSLNDFSISKDYLLKMLFGNLDLIKNKNILEIGGGAGRFTEYFAKYSKLCVSIDMSSSVYHNVSVNNKNIVIIKSDFNKLISNKKFDIVFCRGVLQHTKNPLGSLLKIHEFVSDAGYVFFDIYKMPKIGYAHPKYFFWRPLIKTFFNYDSFENFLKNNIKFLLKIKRFLKLIFFNSKFLSDIIVPVWDYKDQYPLSNNQLEKWAIMDTLDGIFAKYDYPQSNKRIVKFLNANKIKILKNNKNINIFQTQNKKYIKYL